MATKKRNISAKKQSISGASPRSYSELYKGDKTRAPQVTNAPSKKVTVTQESVAAAKTLDWREEYAHVVRDLRTLLLVSGVLFAIIIITSFFV